MKLIPYYQVALRGGYLYEKQELNTKVTIPAVYDRFYETGRVNSFKLGYPDRDPVRPHFFWDSDIAKWIESAAYVLKREANPDLESKVDSIVDDMAENQGEDGYFNVYFTVVEPENRWKCRDWHELYCAGHLMEAAVAYAEATGKTKMLDCMEKYADYIHKVFIEEESANFKTPGHEEIELALIRMYRYTGKKKYLDMADHFLTVRGAVEEDYNNLYYQADEPVRQQRTVRGHAVRSMYLCTGLAYLAAETGEEALVEQVKDLWEDAVNRKMYITGGLGSTYIGEAFTTPFDLPPDQAYTETCAGIGLCFFSQGMLALDNHARYADVIERALYNGVTSGLSVSGDQFFYENPLEINLSERYENRFGSRRFPAHRRVACFGCSCCPPNVNRLLASLGGYLYGVDQDTLFVNQFVASDMQTDGVSASMETDYPRDGRVTVKAEGVAKLAIRIPSWCDGFTLDRPYVMEDGYAVVENDGQPVTVVFDMPTCCVWADRRVLRAMGQVAIMRGPVVYCAEGVDNGEGDLHNFLVTDDFAVTVGDSEAYGLPTLTVSCAKRVDEGQLYSHQAPQYADATLKLIPYNAFANREETDMRVWFLSK